jgi:hypothetical protein
VSGFVAAALRGAAQDAQASARKAMRQGIALTLGCLIGTAGLGFLTASAFLALKAALGATTAALLVGLTLSISAGGILAVARSRAQRPLPAGWAPPRPAAQAPHPPDGVPLLAFTAAFVLARYLTGRLRE